MTFHTQSKNRKKIKIDNGRHILNCLNFNIKPRKRPILPSFEKDTEKSANDSLRDVYIKWMYTHTHTQLASYTHREICNHVLERKKSSKSLNLNKK